MIIKSFYESDSGTWTYLLACPETGSAAVIDPVWVFDPVSAHTDETFIEGVLAAADEAGFHIEWVLETHAHADHLSAAGLLRRRTGARLACGRGIRGVQENFARVFNLRDLPADGRQFDRLLAEGDELRIGRLVVRVMETPGHTADSISYVVEDAAFVGDTLFAPGYGTARCDFPGGDAGQLYESIRRLYELPGDTRLFLCHDYPDSNEQPVRDVTVDESRRSNIHLAAETPKETYVAMREQRDSQLGLPRLILPSLQVNILGGEAPPAEDNGVSYLRLPLNRSIKDLIMGEKI